MANTAKTVSLFAGAGGMDVGFAFAGYELCWANEFDPDAARTHRRNLNSLMMVGDIRSIDAALIPECDIVIGGPPCQGFSVAGKMDPNDRRSELVWEFVRVVREKRPTAFVMENVKALATLSRWASLRERLVRELEEIGYSVAMRVLRASDFGVPQKRERVFFVGSTEAQATELLPTAESSPRLTARSAFTGLPHPGEAGNELVCTAKISLAKSPVLRKSAYAGMLFNGAGRPIDLSGLCPTLPASMGGNKTPIVDTETLLEGSDSWVESYHEHLVEGGKVRKTAPNRLRRITVREAARLQSFKDDFEFTGSKSAIYSQIGNAVPPQLAYHVARAVANAHSWHCNEVAYDWRCVGTASCRQEVDVPLRDRFPCAPANEADETTRQQTRTGECITNE